MSKELEALKLLKIEYDKLDYTINIDGVDVIDTLEKGLEKLDRIQAIIDVRRFKEVNDTELLRNAIREVLEYE